MKLHSELSVIYSNALAMLSIEKNLVRDSIDFIKMLFKYLPSSRIEELNFFLSSSRASMNFLKIASLHITFENFCLHHLESL